MISAESQTNRDAGFIVVNLTIQYRTQECAPEAEAYQKEVN